jgi:predicted GNAT family N-acyltransferase
LWARAKSDAFAQGAPGPFTVNSSLYARPLYERFGFVATSAPVVKDGIAFVPMELTGFSPESQAAQPAP